MIQNKVLVRAGRFQGGKLPYVNYVGQIKPADMSKIIWWGDFGNDGTGDGSISAPFLTFGAALDAFATTTHKWILKTDLTVYGEAEPAAYIDDPADRVYLDPTKADDTGDGLTAATAKKTYAAAKTVLGSSGRSAIHCIGSFTLTDAISARTQGEVGQTLTINKAPDYTFTLTDSQTSEDHLGAIQTSSGALIVIGSDPDLSAGAAVRGLIKRSIDGGQTWAVISHPWTSVKSSIFQVAEGGGVLVAVGIFLTTNVVLRSTDDGLTWSQVTVSGGIAVNYAGVAWTGSNFVVFGIEMAGAFPQKIFTSPTGAIWTSRTTAMPSGHASEAIASDGAGKVMITGRNGGTAGSMQFSTDHGVTWADYSTVTGLGVGANTGGAINYACAYADGKWWIFQDTIATSVYYSTSPTTLWSGMTSPVNFTATNLNKPSVQVGYSSVAGGFIVPETDSFGGSIMLVTSASAVLFTSVGVGFYDNYASLPFTYNGGNFILITGRTNVNGGRTAVLSLDTANIFGNITNAKIHPSNLTKLAPGVQARNFSSEPTAGQAAYSAHGCEFDRCRIVSTDDKPLTHVGDSFKARRNIIKGTAAAVITGKAIANGDIDISKNIVACDLLLNNTAGTDKEIIQDNLIEGNFEATELVTVKSNITGSVVNSTSQSIVSTIPAIFVDTTDYFLSRIALGQAVDSPLINRSAYFSYTYNAATYKDDFGPYRAFTALVQTVFREAFLLPRFGGNALSEDVENVAALLKSIRGKPDVSNRPQGRLDYLSWQSKSINSEVRRFVSYMEKLTDLTVYLDYDFNGQAPGAITINGAHSAGTFEINIQPLDIPVGTVVSLFGKSQIVTQRYPRAGAATKLILDDVLGGGLSDAQSVEITYIQGAGEFVYVPNRPRKNLRIFSRKKDAYSGMVYTFVRKAE